MKPTGIVRRIDDLGRVVMPKELRRTMRIHEGDPLEVYTEGDKIILKKYASSVPEIGDLAKDYAKSLSEATGQIAIVADEENFIAVAGAPQRDYLNKAIPDYWVDQLAQNSSGIFTYTDANSEEKTVAYASIDAKNGHLGVVALMNKDVNEVGEVELKLVRTAAEFIAKSSSVK